jgi:tetratricopeptide (TPR) repeat protein
VAAETKAAVADQVASADHSFDSQQHTSSLDASKSKARKIRNLAVAAAISAVSVTGFFLTEQLGANSSQDITHDYTMWMLSRKAAAAQHDENYAEAAPLYERIVRLNRKHKLLNFDEGDAAVESLVSCDLHLGKYDDARRVIREQFAKSGPRIRKESGGPALAGRYLTAADMIPDREDGVVFLKEIVATMRSKSEPAWQPYANMLIGRLTSMHRNDAAIALADEVLPAFEDDADKVVLLNSKGLALRQAQRLDEANEAFRQAVALAKDKDFTNASVLQSVGTADLFLGRYIEARQTLEEASTDPNLAPSVRPTLANCYASLGNYHAAARALTDSLDDALKQEPLAAAFTRSAVASSCKTILAGISSTAGDDHARFERIQRRAQTETTPIPHPN